MGKGIILGIDFSIDFTQMAVLDDEINPRSISIGTEDNFLIPSVVCYNSELNEWSAGDEAVNKSRLNNSTEYRKLPEILKQNYGEDLTKQIITTYMSYLLKVAVNYSNGKLIKNVLVTLNEVTPEMIEEIKKMTPSVDEVINNTPIAYDTSDLAMVSAMIECEAANQPYEGKLAVGSVIVNRVNSPKFGNTIQSVLYAPSQFSPVASGRFAIVLARGANAECTRAANEVLNGHITIAALYFHVYDSTVDKGGTIIGDHVFY